MAKSYVGGKAGNDDLRADYGNTEGSNINAGAGDDILRGGKYADLLTGGAGNDQLFGGAGGDQFRFFANQIEGSADTDRIYDLTFSEGDSLVFGSFSAGYFEDAEGINAYTSDTGATITSWEGVVNLVADSEGQVTVQTFAGNNNLLLTLNDGAISQSILITGGASQYNAALNDVPA